MPLSFALDGAGTLRDQLVRVLKGHILDGLWRAGMRMPSTRELARDLDVSRTTTMAAYEQLLAEGYLQAERGAGTFVAFDLPTHPRPPQPKRATQLPMSEYGSRLAKTFAYPYAALESARPVRYELLYGAPDARGFPLRAFKRALSRHLEGASVRDLMYGNPAGHHRLRQAIADHLVRMRGLLCTAEQVVVLSGAQQGLQLVTRLLVGVDEQVVVEDPCYIGATRTFSAEGARLVHVPVDEDGLVVPSLPESARLVYVTPSHQFPTGAVLSLPRRLELMKWVNRVGAYVIEDDYDGAFRFEGSPIEPLQRLDDHGRVIYLGSFSKSAIPAIRLGYAVVPPALLEPLRSAKWLADWSSPTILQAAMADFMEAGHYDRHLRRSRSRLHKRRDALLAAIARHLGDRTQVQGIGAGLHLLLWLNNVRPTALDEVIARAREAGVGIYSAMPYFTRTPHRAAILLGYALLTERQLQNAVKRLAAILP